MTDPTRLLDHRLAPAVHRALTAAIAAEPPPSAKTRLWDSLALTLPAVGVLLDVTTTSSAAATRVATSAAEAAATQLTEVVHQGHAGTMVAASSTAGTEAAFVAGTKATQALVATVKAGAIGGAAVAKGTSLGIVAAKAIALGLGIGMGLNVAASVVEPRLKEPTAAVSIEQPTKATGIAPHAAGSNPQLAALAPLGADSGREPPTANEFDAPDETSAVKAVTPGGRVATSETPDALVSAKAEAPFEVPTAAATDRSGRYDADELRHESLVIASARQAMRGADHLAALAALEEHERRFPNGKLIQEREALLVRALADAGRSAESQIRGRAFLARFPMSPHGERIRVLLGECQPPACPSR